MQNLTSSFATFSVPHNQIHHDMQDSFENEIMQS